MLSIISKFVNLSMFNSWWWKLSILSLIKYLSPKYDKCQPPLLIIEQLYHLISSQVNCNSLYNLNTINLEGDIQFNFEFKL